MTGRALFIGRFQPFHLGHLAVVKHLASTHSGVILGIGSAFDSHTAANPFTAGERFAMIEAALAEAGIRNVVIVPIPDLNRNALWVSHVRSLVPPFEVLVSNNALPRRLFSEAGFKVESFPLVERERYSATRIRGLLLSGGAWHELVPPGVARVMREVGAEDRVRALATSDR